MMDDITLVDKWKAENAEQFSTLVRMHLSFVLDLNAEDCDGYSDRKARPLKWTIGLPFAKKMKGNTKPFEHIASNAVNQMTILIEYLSSEECLTQEGIFRRTGKLKRQQELKMKLFSGEPIDLSVESYSVHDCASVLKTILAELPEPLLMEAHYPAYCQVAELRENKDRLLLAVQLLILLLPTENRSFLQQLLRLLSTISLHVEQNRMSSDNLATLFTPHLMCPRRLSPEDLHAHSRLLSCVVAFMIEKSEEVFRVPDTLATDVRVYWEKRERRRRSPLRQLNESICDGTTVNTVFTFVDRERTAQENGSNPTELELAKLYAHIQSLPDSAMKRRHVKNFNKKNGQVTPAVRSEERNKHRRTRSLKDSIKKHLSGFSKTGKTSEAASPISDTSHRSPNSMKTPHIAGNSKPKPRPQIKQELLKISKTPSKENINQLANNISRSKSCDALNTSVVAEEPTSSVQTRARKKSPENRSLKRSTPVSCQSKLDYSTSVKARSAKKQPTAIAPSLVLPTKRTSPLKIPSNNTKSPELTVMSQLNRNKQLWLASKIKCDDLERTGEQRESLLGKRPSPEAIISCKPAKRLSPVLPPPASVTPLCTPLSETMMTPRSRKPVVSLSGTDLCHLSGLDHWSPGDVGRKLILEEPECSDPYRDDLADSSLSTTFRDYIYTRSALTTSPVDLSFSSRTDDFQSCSSSGKTSIDDLPSLEGQMSQSLLFCLDGNNPNEKQPSGCDCSQHVCETAI